MEACGIFHDIHLFVTMDTPSVYYSVVATFHLDKFFISNTDIVMKICVRVTFNNWMLWILHRSMLNLSR